MFTFLRRLLRRFVAPKLKQLEIVDCPLNRVSNFWWEARQRGDRVTLVGDTPDGLLDVMVTRVYAPGDSVTDNDGHITWFPNGAEQPELVQGVNAKRFKEKV